MDTITSVNVPRAQIHVDPSLNSRKTWDEKSIQRLTQSIRAQGIIHPCLLIASGQLGKKYEAIAPYTLICGFRRQEALDTIHGKEEGVAHDYRLAPDSWGLKEALAANLTENLAREDISSYELAVRCAEMRDLGMSPKDIAHAVKALDSEQTDRKPLSETHINNLVRCATQLHPQILEAWKAQHPRASVRVMIQLAAEKDEALQLAAWQGIENPETTTPEEESGEGKSEGSDLKEPKDKRRRPTAPQLEIMIASVKAAGKQGSRDAEFVRGAIAALKYAMGQAAGIPGVKQIEDDNASD